MKFISIISCKLSTFFLSLVGRGSSLPGTIANILDKNIYQNNFNCIIIVRKSILDRSFSEMETDLFKLCKRLDILKGECYEK